MNKKSVVIIIILVVVILISVSSWLIYTKFIKKPMEQDELPPAEGDDKIPGPISGGGSGSSTSIGITPSFPIKKGMKGQMVVDVQNAINKKCNANIVPDGAFGPKTEAAIKACYGVTTVNETVYAQMKSDISGTTCPSGQYKVPGIGCIPISIGSSTSSTKMKKGDAVYAKMDPIVIFSLPAGNASIGKIVNFDLKNSIGSYEADSTEGFSKIWLTKNYVKNNGMLGSAMTMVYVYSSLIKK